MYQKKIDINNNEVYVQFPYAWEVHTKPCFPHTPGKPFQALRICYSEYKEKKNTLVVESIGNVQNTENNAGNQHISVQTCCNTWKHTMMHENVA